MCGVSDCGHLLSWSTGVPLLEIVSEPDMRSARDAAAYGAELRRICRFLGISDGEQFLGSPNQSAAAVHVAAAAVGQCP